VAKILVTGGAGYIGSHVVKQLLGAGHAVVVLDNLSKGFAGAVSGGELVVGDTGDAALLDRLLQGSGVEAVMHFAAWTVVPESVAEPYKYYANNTFNAATLIERCARHGVKSFIFSSTAATYGIPPSPRCDESTPTAPINPYGWSKLMAEQILRDVCQARGMRHVILRYFNVAGSDPDGAIGQSTRDATLLIKVACEAALGMRECVEIFGTDLPTADGTGVRDYIHVHDLASAHLRALDYLAAGGASRTLNCGYGHGFSVREVLAVVERLHGAPFSIKESGRRAGDPPELVADSSALRRLLAWQPRYDDLEAIVATTLAWQRKLRDGLVQDGRANSA